MPDGLFAGPRNGDGAGSIRLKMMFIIVNRTDNEKTVKFLREKGCHFQFSCVARGTYGSTLLDVLGLGQTEKSMIICVAHGYKIDSLLAETPEIMKLNRAGKGIAFSVPVSGINMPKTGAEKNHPATNAYMAGQSGTPIDLDKTNDLYEGDADIMNNKITHNLILAIVDHGNSEEVVIKAKNAGAKGGTVLNARGTGAEAAVKFFGLTVQSEKEIIAILAKRINCKEIMDSINEAFGAESPAHGIILSLPVDGAVGAEFG